MDASDLDLAIIPPVNYSSFFWPKLLEMLDDVPFCLYLMDASDMDLAIIPPVNYSSFFWPKLLEMVSPTCEETNATYGFSYFF
uniref:Ovule protein n=1 Tax=Steinernema glaseri TaxID=37863 RepID=A0A1I7XXN0_9BILA